MARTRDLGRSRQIIAERKQRRAEMIWAPEHQVDRSWQRFTKCKGCGMKLCVNNYPDHKVRVGGLRRSGCVVKRTGIANGILILCWRCARFEFLFDMLLDKIESGSKKAQKLWDLYPMGPTPGQTGRN